MGTTPQVLRAHLKQETERWTQLIKAAGISAD
jgi:tripartite-type tricarboxylate transporter receptor subunit TctC